MAGLLKALVSASEKAADIARLCRHEEPLFQLLVAEKTGADKNRRFLQDFKTLADVLIQEVIKHDLGTEFPELQGHIGGEESNEFTNAQGETVAVRVCGTVGETAALLGSVLAPEQAAAELLAAAAHRDAALGDAALDGLALSIHPGDLAIWIDPIDSTNEYIGGREDVAPVDGISPAGLCSALVLIGAYDRCSGCPVLGVINEPFFRRDPLTHRWQGRYHWGVAYQDTRLCSLSPPPPPRPPPRVVLSRAEGPGVRAALHPLCGGRLHFAAGAGYKMLCVILGLADAYVLSEGSTFAWDACAPHAILRALGLAMALEGGMKCVKFLVFIFNFIFWVCGVALVAIGIYAQVALNKALVMGSAPAASSPVAILVVGVVIFFVSFFGCCGAWKESYCMVTTFAVLLSIIFLVEIAAAIAGYVFKDKVRSKLEEGLWDTMRKYGQDQPLTEAVDKLQEDFHCCGASNYTDWASLEQFRANDTVPRSCCRINTTTCNIHPSPATIYEKGCLQAVEAWMKKNILIVAAVALGIAFFEILGIIFTCCLMKGIRSGYEVM